MKSSILREKSKAFSLRIIKLYKFLREGQNEYVMSKQLLRSGTSIGANIAEAFYSESHLDFIHKLAIAQKECSETIYWIELLNESGYIFDEGYNSIYIDACELMKLLTKSIKTVKDKISITHQLNH